jgi:hypothetical protein
MTEALLASRLTFVANDQLSVAYDQLDMDAAVLGRVLINAALIAPLLTMSALRPIADVRRASSKSPPCAKSGHKCLLHAL